MKTKNLLSFVLAAALVLTGASLAYAKAEDGAGSNGSGQQVQQATQATNQGQDTQVQIQNNEEAQVGNGAGEGEREREQQRLQDGTEAGGQQQAREMEQKQDEKGGSDRAKERRGEVANAVQQLLQVADSNQTVGEQIRVIAQNQNQNHEKLEQSLQTVQNRNKFLRFLIGINYGEAKNAEGLVEQSKAKIQELEQLKTQITDSAQLAKINEQIKALQDINTEVETALKESEKSFSLLGWAFKLFSK